MKIVAAFAVFITATIITVATGVSIIIALLIGLASFLILGINMDYKAKDLGRMCIDGVKESAIVIQVLSIIGFITAIWRVSGTITTFAYYGMKFITPYLFLIIVFVLTCVLSYALGTSFGVAGTIGVIFMTLARSGGVDPVITAGVIISGIYFGDRCSPVSSSANMVAAVTKTKIYDNVKLMMRTSIVPLGITLAIYTVLSVMNPLKQIDPSVSKFFENEFSLSMITLIPAAIMLILPLLKVDLIKAMLLSIGSGVLIAWKIEKVSLILILKTGIFGYSAADMGMSADSNMAAILNGGGLVSMLEVVIIVTIAGAYSGLFSGTGMLYDIQDKLQIVCEKRGRYFAMFCTSACISLLFSMQIVASLLCADLLEKPYLNTGGTKEELAIDIENSVILMSNMIPWGIGCYVPLAFLGADLMSMAYAVYIYILPISYFFVKRRWFSDKSQKRIFQSSYQ